MEPRYDLGQTRCSRLPNMAPRDNEDPDRTAMGIDAIDLGTTSGGRDRPYLVVLAGPNLGEMYPVEGAEAFVGRGEGASIRLKDDAISRKHVRLALRGNEVLIEDLRSANGTLVNGAPLTGATRLRDGDQIQLGATTILKFTFHDKLEEAFRRQMYDAALRDPMTKAFNKTHLLDRLTAELGFARRHQRPLGLLMIDVDHFKRVNDTFGHVAGDHVLTKLASEIQTVLRVEDLLARYGGEEFAVLSRSGASSEEAPVLAERIRTSVERASFVFQDRVIPVTVSIGVATYPSTGIDLPAALISRADEALYKAKRLGRNRVIVRGG